MKRAHLLALCFLLLLACLVIDASYLAIGVCIGGFADEERSVDGHFYLVDNGIATMGPYKEVSRATFTYSHIHGRVFIIAVPLGLLAAVSASYLQKKA